MSDSKQFEIKPFSLADCNRCGSTQVFWVRSWNTGRAYLVDVAVDQDGKLTTSRSSWHSKTCPGTRGAQIVTGPQTASQSPVVPAVNPSVPAPAVDARFVPAVPPTAPVADDRPIEDVPLQDVPPNKYSRLPVLSVEMLREPETHQVIENVISDNLPFLQSQLAHLFSLPAHTPSHEQPGGGTAVLDRPAAPNPLRQAPAAPKQRTRKPAQDAQAPEPDKYGEYLCNNSGCSIVSMRAIIRPGKPHLCPNCSRVMLFKGLSAE